MNQIIDKLSSGQLGLLLVFLAIFATVIITAAFRYTAIMIRGYPPAEKTEHLPETAELGKPLDVPLDDLPPDRLL